MSSCPKSEGQIGYTGVKPEMGATIQLNFGNDVVPAAATPVALNVTATEPDLPGFLTVYPCSEGRPTASNLNFAAGDSIANLVVAKLDNARSVCIFASASTHVVVDLQGWLGAP